MPAADTTAAVAATSSRTLATSVSSGSAGGVAVGSGVPDAVGEEVAGPGRRTREVAAGGHQARGDGRRGCPQYSSPRRAQKWGAGHAADPSGRASEPCATRSDEPLSWVLQLHKEVNRP